MGAVHAKPALSTVQIWNMCFGFFGIQIGFGLQNANVSRIFQTLGAEVEAIPILWIAAPLTGLLVQPIIGYMSDRTWGRMGRRRPYFFYGALLTTAALLIMPNSPYLWVAAGMLWIMDASINITMEPFRAFVGDMLPERQRTQGFAMQSLFIGVGAVVASAMPYIFAQYLGVANTAAEGVIPDSVHYSFYVGAFFLLASVMWTVFTTKEYPPEDLAAFEAQEVGILHDAGAAGPKAQHRSPKQYFTTGGLWLIVSGVATVIIAQMALEKELFILSVGGVAFGLLQIFAGYLAQRGRTDNGFSEVLADLFAMPQTMRRLAVVQFFSWFALFSMWIYTTTAVTAYHYGTTDPTSLAYNDGANWVSLLFGAYNGVAALAALFIPLLARRIGRKGTHALCLLAGACGLVSIWLIKDPAWLWLSMVGVGIAWASILSVPYAILSGVLPAAKMGVFMGIFNFFIVIPQLTAASILAILVDQLFGGDVIYALVAGGVSLALAALATAFVPDPHEDGAHTRTAQEVG